jgi:DNA helicase-2/ATP-dependent DNA helicase PcrA
MTRAKTSLDLISPLKYYVTQQSRMGDRHVYGAKSRFLTREVMACFQPVSWSDEREKNAAGTKAAPVDVAGKLRGMWA